MEPTSEGATRVHMDFSPGAIVTGPGGAQILFDDSAGDVSQTMSQADLW